MPRLLLFVSCEKVITGQDDNSVSLISLIHDITVNVGDDAIPDQAAAGVNWCAFTMWRSDPGEEGKSFAQHIELFDPQGKRLVSSEPMEFTTERLINRGTFRVNVFPIPKTPGECSLRLFLRENVEGATAQHVASYPIGVVFKRLPGPNPTT